MHIILPILELKELFLHSMKNKHIPNREEREGLGNDWDGS